MTFDLDSPAADDSDRVCFTVWEVYAIILPVLIGLTFLPSFKILAFSAYIGSIFLVLAVSVSQCIPLSLISLISYLFLWVACRPKAVIFQEDYFD